MEERIQQRQYDNLLRQIEEDTLAEIECQRLQTQAKEAQRVQEEALMAKEALSNQLERRRKLKKAETDLEVWTKQILKDPQTQQCHHRSYFIPA